MLIIKGNFPKFKLWMGWASLLLACLLAGPAGAAPPAAPRPTSSAASSATSPAAHRPDAVAAEFYGWYLETLSADQDPLSDRYDTFMRYVSKTLSTRLVERLKSGHPPDSDYFIQSAGYREAWLRAVQASVVHQRGVNAEVRVTLGKDRRTLRVLQLAMVLEDGAWKIRSVGLMGDDVFKSSTEQPVI